MRLIEISRPVLWINTIGTTIVAMWITGALWDWRILPILIWVTFPFNLLIYGINDILIATPTTRTPARAAMVAPRSPIPKLAPSSGVLFSPTPRS